MYITIQALFTRKVPTNKLAIELVQSDTFENGEVSDFNHVEVFSYLRTCHRISVKC